jgi:hypothetical protein
MSVLQDAVRDIKRLLLGLALAPLLLVPLFEHLMRWTFGVDYFEGK